MPSLKLPALFHRPNNNTIAAANQQRQQPIGDADDDDDDLLLSYVPPGEPINTISIGIGGGGSGGASISPLMSDAATPATVAAGVSPATPFVAGDDDALAVLGSKRGGVRGASSSSVSVQQPQLSPEEGDATPAVTAAPAVADDDDDDSDDDIPLGALPQRASLLLLNCPPVIAAPSSSSSSHLSTMKGLLGARCDDGDDDDGDENSTSRPLTLYGSGGGGGGALSHSATINPLLHQQLRQGQGGGQNQRQLLSIKSIVSSAAAAACANNNNTINNTNISNNRANRNAKAASSLLVRSGTGAEGTGSQRQHQPSFATSAGGTRGSGTLSAARARRRTQTMGRDNDDAGGGGGGEDASSCNADTAFNSPPATAIAAAAEAQGVHRHGTADGNRSAAALHSAGVAAGAVAGAPATDTQQTVSSVDTPVRRYDPFDYHSNNSFSFGDHGDDDDVDGGDSADGGPSYKRTTAAAAGVLAAVGRGSGRGIPAMLGHKRRRSVAMGRNEEDYGDGEAGSDPKEPRRDSGEGAAATGADADGHRIRNALLGSSISDANAAATAVTTTAAAAAVVIGCQLFTPSNSQARCGATARSDGADAHTSNGGNTRCNGGAVLVGLSTPPPSSSSFGGGGADVGSGHHTPQHQVLLGAHHHSRVGAVPTAHRGEIVSVVSTPSAAPTAVVETAAAVGGGARAKAATTAPAAAKTAVSPTKTAVTATAGRPQQTSLMTLFAKKAAANAAAAADALLAAKAKEAEEERVLLEVKASVAVKANVSIHAVSPTKGTKGSAGVDASGGLPSTPHVGGEATAAVPQLAPSSSSSHHLNLPLHHTNTLVQSTLDFGQRNIGATTCPRCGMLYNRCEEDVQLHKAYCAKIAKSERQTSSSSSSGGAFHDLIVFEKRAFNTAMKQVNALLNTTRRGGGGGGGGGGDSGGDRTAGAARASGGGSGLLLAPSLPPPPALAALASLPAAAKPLAPVAKSIVERKEYEVYLLPSITTLCALPSAANSGAGSTANGGGGGGGLNWLQQGGPFQVIQHLYPDAQLAVAFTNAQGGSSSSASSGSGGTSAGSGVRGSGGGSSTRGSTKRNSGPIFSDALSLTSSSSVVAPSSTGSAAAVFGGASSSSSSLLNGRLEVAFIAAYTLNKRSHEPMLAIDTDEPAPHRSQFYHCENPSVAYRAALARYHANIRVVERKTSVDINYCYLSRKVVTDNAKKLPANFFAQVVKPSPERERRNQAGHVLLSFVMQAIREHAVYGVHLADNALAYSSALPSLSVLYHSTDLLNALNTFMDARTNEALLLAAQSEAKARVDRHGAKLRLEEAMRIVQREEAEAEEARRRGERGAGGGEGSPPKELSVAADEESGGDAQGGEDAKQTANATAGNAAANDDDNASLLPSAEVSLLDCATATNAGVAGAPSTPPPSRVTADYGGERGDGGQSLESLAVVRVAASTYSNSRFLRAMPILFAADEDALPYGKLKVTEFYA